MNKVYTEMSQLLIPTSQLCQEVNTIEESEVEEEMDISYILKEVIQKLGEADTQLMVTDLCILDDKEYKHCVA